MQPFYLSSPTSIIPLLLKYDTDREAVLQAISRHSRTELVVICEMESISLSHMQAINWLVVQSPAPSQSTTLSLGTGDLYPALAAEVKLKTICAHCTDEKFIVLLSVDNNVAQSRILTKVMKVE